MRARVLWFGIPVIMAAILMAVFSTGQSVPQLINYQGRLTNPAGQPLDGATVDLTFSFYGAQTGNTAFLSILQNNVLVTAGVYNVLLGSGTITPGDRLILGIADSSPPYADIGCLIKIGEIIEDRGRLTQV